MESVCRLAELFIKSAIPIPAIRGIDFESPPDLVNLEIEHIVDDPNAYQAVDVHDAPYVASRRNDRVHLPGERGGRDTPDREIVCYRSSMIMPGI
jgi:hypothetical protein